MRLKESRPRCVDFPNPRTDLPVKHLLTTAFRLAVSGLQPFVAAVCAEPVAIGIISKAYLEETNQTIAAGRVFDRNEQFDTAVEVPRHPIGTGDKDPLITAVMEMEDAAMLQEPIDDTDHRDILAHFLYPGPQAADAPDIELDFHIGG